ncbi:MAG: PH domain-containing protein [Planctomycetota bacterium]|nr:PH domain-containing protein [Planctomycetota bacterium]
MDEVDRDSRDAPRLDRLHGATLLVEVVRFAKSWAIPLVLLLFVAGREQGAPWWLWLGLFGAGSSFLATAIRFFTLRYGVVGDRLIIRSGIVFRQNRTIPVDRIQNLHLKSGVVHRAFGVVDVRVETAGTGEAEAQLSVIKAARAETFRGQVLGGRREPVSPGEDDRGELVRRSRLGELLLAGATENRILVLVAALWGLFEIGQDTGFDVEGMINTVGDRLPGGAAAPAAAVVALAVLGLTFFGLGWIASILWTVVTYYGFTLRRRGRDLRKTHGLLTRFESTIPVARIQAVRLEASLPRRALNVLQVLASTAGSKADDHQGGTSVIAPLLQRSEADDFCRVVYPDMRLEDVRLERVHPRARRRGFIRLLIPGVVLATVFLVRGSTWPWVALALWVAFSWVLARARYAILGYGVFDRFLVARSGVWTRKLWIVPQEKLQAVRVERGPLQRVLGLATLQVSTAGGGSLSRVHIADMGAPEADGMFEQLSRAAARGGSGV